MTKQKTFFKGMTAEQILSMEEDLEQSIDASGLLSISFTVPCYLPWEVKVLTLSKGNFEHQLINNQSAHEHQKYFFELEPVLVDKNQWVYLIWTDLPDDCPGELTTLMHLKMKFSKVKFFIFQS